MTGREEQAAVGAGMHGADGRQARRSAHTARRLHDVKYDEAGLPIRRRPTPALAERVRRLLYG